MLTFVEKKLITFFACCVKDPQNLLIQSFSRCKVRLFSLWLNSQTVDIEYPKGICSQIFVIEEFSGLFIYPSFFSNER